MWRSPDFIPVLLVILGWLAYHASRPKEARTTSEQWFRIVANLAPMAAAGLMLATVLKDA